MQTNTEVQPRNGPGSVNATGLNVLAEMLKSNHLLTSAHNRDAEDCDNSKDDFDEPADRNLADAKHRLSQNITSPAKKDIEHSDPKEDDTDFDTEGDE